MLNNKDYCDYETCVALVELGMRITSRKVYSERDTLKHSSRGITYTVRTASAMGWVIAILLYEAQKWLREVKKIDVGATWDNDEDNWFCYIKQMGFPDWSGTSVSHSCYSSYEEALSEGIKEAVEILKEK